MKKIFLLFFLSAFFSCASEKTLDEFDFLIGKWQGVRDDMVLLEIWKKESNTCFTGKGIVLLDADTLFHEKLSIEVRAGKIFYVAKIPSNPGPVSFLLVHSENNSWKFENKEHDFPQTIVYTFFPPDSTVAVIEGLDKKKPSREEFHFKKVN